MLKTIEHNGNIYPEFQAQGNAAQFAKPFALHLCKGYGCDVGANRAEWALPDALLIDPEICKEYHAMNLPPSQFDYIHSSHMLEHYVGRFQEVIEYWLTKLKDSGIIFLYLPNCDNQSYWAFSNTKHIHYLNPSIMSGYCEHLKINGLISKYMVTEGYDLNSSFYCVIEK